MSRGRTISWLYCVASCLLRPHLLTEDRQTVIGISPVSSATVKRAQWSGIFLPRNAVLLFDFSTNNTERGMASNWLKTTVVPMADSNQIVLIASVSTSAPQLFANYRSLGFEQILPLTESTPKRRLWIIRRPRATMPPEF